MISVLSINQRVKEYKSLKLLYRSITWAGLYTNKPFSNTERFRWRIAQSFLGYYTNSIFLFTDLLYTLILHKQILGVFNTRVSKYVVICLQKTASFVLAFSIYNRVRTCTATASVIVTTSVTVLPPVHRFQNVDLSSIIATNGR